MSSQEQIVTSQKLSSSPSGCDCTFVKIGNSGMKIYREQKHRDRQFDLQGKFHKHGLAPQCWFSFDFKGPNGQTLYAYYSEVAETQDTLGYDRCRDLIARLRDRVENEFGVKWGDHHADNVGVLNGADVIIDFGYMKNCENL